MTKQKKKAPQYKGQKKSKALLHFQTAVLLTTSFFSLATVCGGKSLSVRVTCTLLLVSFSCVLSEGGSNSVVTDAKDSSGRWEKIITGWKSDWFVVRHGALKPECKRSLSHLTSGKEGEQGGCK